MGKPQKHIRVRQQKDGSYRLVARGGIEITGISLNQYNQTFYSIPSPGQRTYHGRDLQKIVRDYLHRRPEKKPLQKTFVTDGIDPESLRLHHETVTAIAAIRDGDDPASVGLEEATAQETIDAANRVLEMKSGTVEIDQAELEKRIDNPFFRIVINKIRAKQGKPPLPPLPSDEPDQQKPSSQRLRDVVREWREAKQSEGCKPGYMSDVERIWERFIKLIGNKPISELTGDDFTKWRRWVVKERLKREVSNKWQNDHNKNIKYVFDTVKIDRPGWRWPTGLLEWAGSFKSERHVVAKKNRDRMPVETFRRLLAVTDEWKAANPEEFSKDTQRGRARRLQASNKRAEGIRLAAMVRLAANCSLDNVDLRRITWNHVRNLESNLPFMDFPRVKPEKKVGAPVDRKTPLLPSTVRSLCGLRESDGRDGYVFRTSASGPYTESGLNGAWRRLFKAAEVTHWKPKHMRNIAPSLGKERKLSRDERDAILGHSVGGTSKFYEDDVDETYLIRLVNIVGAEYFDGDRIEHEKAD